MDQLSEAHYFSSPVYMVRKREFLDTVRSVSDRYLEKATPIEGHPTKMTLDYSTEPELSGFSDYVAQTAWNILASQGYNMDQLVTYFTEMWTQEHGYMSSMETHVHGMGSQISAFYFLEAPQGGCNLVIHDPRPAKVIVNLPEADVGKITSGTNQIVFTPEAGALILTNSWLSHSFTRNTSKDPVRFVHMNLSVTLATQSNHPTLEIV